MGHVGLLWTGMSIYNDLSGHWLEAHSRWVGSSGLADCGLYTYTEYNTVTLYKSALLKRVPFQFIFISLGLSILS